MAATRSASTAATVTNLVMTGVEVMNFGNGVDEHGVQLHNLWGTGSVTNGSFHDNEGRQFYISNGSGTLTTFNISNSQFANAPGPNGLQGLQIETFNPGTTATVNTTLSVFQNVFNTGWQAQASSNSTLTANVTSSDMTNNNAAVIIQAASGGQLTSLVENNDTLTGALSGTSAMNITTTSGGNLDATVRSNRIGNTNANSGALCNSCNGIIVLPREGGSMQLNIVGNTIRHVRQSAIMVLPGQAHLGVWPKVDVVITGNLIQDPEPSPADPLSAISIEAGVSASDATCIAATIGGTVDPGAWPSLTANAMNRIIGDWGQSGANQEMLLRSDPADRHVPDTGAVGWCGGVRRCAQLVQQRRSARERVRARHVRGRRDVPVGVASEIRKGAVS